MPSIPLSINWKSSLRCCKTQRLGILPPGRPGRRNTATYQLADEIPKRVVLFPCTRLAHLRPSSRPHPRASARRPPLPRIQHHQQQHQTRPDQPGALVRPARQEVLVRHRPERRAAPRARAEGGERRVEPGAEEGEHQTPFERVGEERQGEIWGGGQEGGGGVDRVGEEDEEEAWAG